LQQEDPVDNCRGCLAEMVQSVSCMFLGPVTSVYYLTPKPPFYPCAASPRPFPLMLGSILLTESTQGFFPIEFTPLYIGCPPAYTDTIPQLGESRAWTEVPGCVIDTTPHFTPGHFLGNGSSGLGSLHADTKCCVLAMHGKCRNRHLRATAAARVC
jgi:hypothetical protein